MKTFKNANLKNQQKAYTYEGYCQLDSHWQLRHKQFHWLHYGRALPRENSFQIHQICIPAYKD